MNTNSVEVVLFDLGGVIVQFQKTGYFATLLGEADDVTAMTKWLDCPSVQKYEKGEIDRQGFAVRLVENFELTMTPNKFLADFLNWPQDVFPGSEKIVSSIQNSIRVGCLSNTSEFHWHNQKSSDILKEMFELRFLSFELGQLKPDHAIYRDVANRLECVPEAILFFDDNADNVDCAIEFGFDAHLVRGISEAHIILKDYSLLK